MDSKEKAKELVYKFLVDTYDGIESDNGCGITMFQAKICALIAVREIFITGLLIKLPCGLIKLNETHSEYWEQVEKEIELL